MNKSAQSLGRLARGIPKKFSAEEIARRTRLIAEVNARKREKEPGMVTVLDLTHAKTKDAHCLSCGFEMRGGAGVGLCPKCCSNRWYRTKLKT